MTNTPPEWNRLLNIEELSAALGKSRNYVGGMRRAGFLMPGGTATVNEAREWLRENPDYRCKSAWKKPRVKPARPPRVRTL
jgi:hypothetical protein